MVEEYFSSLALFPRELPHTCLRRESLSQTQGNLYLPPISVKVRAVEFVPSSHFPARGSLLHLTPMGVVPSSRSQGDRKGQPLQRERRVAEAERIFVGALDPCGRPASHFIARGSLLHLTPMGNLYLPPYTSTPERGSCATAGSAGGGSNLV